MGSLEKNMVVEPVVAPSGSSQDDGDHKSYNSITDRKLVRKLDIHILTPLILIFFFSFIDRVNIGFARLQGLEKDLHMKGNDFNVALVVFFAPFVVFEVPSNLILRKMRPSIWLGSLSLLWGMFAYVWIVMLVIGSDLGIGVSTIAQGVVKTYHGLVAMRFLLGLFEAGLVPGTYTSLD